MTALQENKTKGNVLTGKTVMIAGLGLMGGAIAMGLRDLEPDWIGAYDTNGEVLENAFNDGVIDQGEMDDDGAAELLKKADLVYLCLYPRQVVSFFKRHMDDFKSGAIITDITGVKGILVKEVLPILRDDVDFVMGHPMAGSEKEGYGGAKQNIFKGHNYILVPTEKNTPEDLDFIKNVVEGLGFSNVVTTTPEGHDDKIAFTSQLCHVIACALIDCREDRHISNFEGGSFMDLTRIAMINAPMWSELFVTNRDALLKQIDGFEASLNKMRDMIKNSDEKGLCDLMQSVRDKRVVIEVDRKNREAAFKNHEKQEEKKNLK